MQPNPNDPHEDWMEEIKSLKIKAQLIDVVIGNPVAHKGIPEAVLQAARNASREVLQILDRQPK